jgi:hypothetical protein
MTRAGLLAIALFGLPAGPASSGEAPCVEVRIGTEPSYACLNALIAKAIPQRRFAAGSDLPIAATIPAPAAGTYNTAASAEQLGTAFGHSTQPQRPPAPRYPAPLLPVR